MSLVAGARKGSKDRLPLARPPRSTSCRITHLLLFAVALPEYTLAPRRHACLLRSLSRRRMYVPRMVAKMAGSQVSNKCHPAGEGPALGRGPRRSHAAVGQPVPGHQPDIGLVAALQRAGNRVDPPWK